MRLSSLHFILTYKCTRECPHCFVFGSPKNQGVTTKQKLADWIKQAADVPSIKWIFFEGGEPFIYYNTLLYGINLSKELGLDTGIVSNGFWGKTIDTAKKMLQPFFGKLDYLQISSDALHGEKEREFAKNVLKAAGDLNIDCGIISVDIPGPGCPAGTGDILFKGRAAEQMADGLKLYPWQTFSECDQENLRNPSRVHVDPFGFAHVCQGITIGNLNKQTLKEICDGFDPQKHPIIGPILRGGPAALVKEYNLPHKDCYIDACHLCYLTRKQLANKMPDTLAPPLLYGN